MSGNLSTPQQLFVGDHPALDFLNTSYTPEGKSVETIGTGRAFAEWLVRVGLVPSEELARLQRRFGTKAIDAAAAEAREVREWLRTWLTRWRAAPRRDYSQEIERLNELLARHRSHREVVATKDGHALVEKADFSDPKSLLGAIAAQIAALIAHEDPELVKRCAGSTCSVWFLDRTKAHRRMFCSPKACGNRAKVAAFRARKKMSAEGSWQ
jgi:predicted RNA-binding Zn ribbon-like protein